MSIGKWEVQLIGCDPEQLKREGRSWLLSVDREHLADCGCLGRVIVWGWSVEVYRAD